MLVAFDVAALLFVALLVALAAWQVHRRAYKLDLIERVEARVHAAPIPAPGPGRWSDVRSATDEYRRVFATGDWLEDRSTFVQAVTALGGGYWVVTPLARDDGTTILVNRGFVPASGREPTSWRPGPKPATVVGLLRMSEPRGGFLRMNDPRSDRWFSRDVAAIAAARGLGDVAPYFIDAERSPGDAGLPVAGLTVIAFSNNHLVYAFTWAALAVMAAAGAIAVNLDQLRRGWIGVRKESPTEIQS
ncbi:SURF1 family protein [Microvirga terrae]|uniref:SURF1-like protein n=1 Tax=Microvirga terrae TaxID=2740529 RepID=A0ABY5RRB5_9HYPH|nr:MULTISPECIES: SURF1 family protein [Microvirga]MBQ0821710.1 SURF1 family protein [Microvirga sp. HBU67558]UVF18876.1 SURF1 family protein [Microvirga terrae]